MFTKVELKIFKEDCINLLEYHFTVEYKNVVYKKEDLNHKSK